MALKVEIIATHTIKPSFPTPPHLNPFKLSLYDQLNPSLYTPLILFYHPIIDDDERQMLLLRLKTSLSDVLTRFYPVSGRITDNVSIDCNDDGVLYLEAKVCSTLSELLKRPQVDVMSNLVPIKLETTESAAIPLLIQINSFDCSGIAIGFSASHKIFDGPTLSTFVLSWANAASSNKETVVSDFKIASLFPHDNSFNSLTAIKIPHNANRLIKKRFVFDHSSIATLKAKIARESDRAHLPTSIQAVSALIWKCAMKASKTRSSISTHSVNMRRRIHPPLPKSSIGNFVGYFSAEYDYNESPIELHYLVKLLKSGLLQFNDNYVEELQGKDGCSAILRSFEDLRGIFKRSNEMEIYSFVSWCGFKLYDADFGWGKPAWTSVTSSPFKNIVHFMDTKERDGIEVWINLKEEHMLVFEQDQELLAFSSPSA